MSLDDYDKNVAHHLREIGQHARSIISHVEYMTHRPDFETMTEEQLANVDHVLANALARTSRAIEELRSKPVDR